MNSEQAESNRQLLRDHASYFAQLDIAALVRKDLGAELEFDGLEDEFLGLKKLGHELISLDLSSVPGGVIGTGIIAAQNARALLDQIDAFSILELAKRQTRSKTKPQ